MKREKERKIKLKKGIKKKGRVKFQYETLQPQKNH